MCACVYVKCGGRERGRGRGERDKRDSGDEQLEKWRGERGGRERDEERGGEGAEATAIALSLLYVVRDLSNESVKRAFPFSS